MKKYLYLIVLAFVFCLNQNVLADPVENDFGIVNAWYNGQEATVKNVSLKIGETTEITVFVYSKIAGNVYVKLINPLVTVPYDIISGPTELDKTIDNYDEYEHVQFTIANPIILDEQYSGSSPSHTTTDPSSTDQSQSNSSPSFGIIGALLSVVLVVMWRQRKI